MQLVGGELERRLEEILGAFCGKRSELIPILQRIQNEFGYLPEDALVKVSRFIGVPEAHVYGVASFYEQLRLRQLGKNIITICRGTSCYVCGSSKLIDEAKSVLGIDEGETTPDLKWTLETVTCLGMCAHAPCAIVNGKVYGKMTPEKLVSIIRAVEGGRRS